MDRFRIFLEQLHDKYITNNFDRIIPVIGDESMGKSTLILEAIWMYEDHRGNNPDPDAVLDRVVFDSKEAFKQELLNAESGDPMAAMDAAHILYKKEAMNPDQIEVEKNLLDVRIENYVIFLGYQDWSDIPDQLQRRRAKNIIRIPQRGLLEGYNRSQIDQKYSKLDKNEWPEPALRDTFPSLEGTELWERFKEVDAERKRERLKMEDPDEGETEMEPQDVVEDILAGDVAEYIEVNEFQDRAYFSKPYIKFQYPSLSDQQADQVRAALDRRVNIDDYVSEGGTDTKPPTPTD